MEAKSLWEESETKETGGGQRTEFFCRRGADFLSFLLSVSFLLILLMSEGVGDWLERINT